MDDSLTIVVRRDSEEPVYGQIARQIRGWIASGRLEPGLPLPPVRTLASDLGVNLNTVARAYRALEEEGFVVIRHRSGAEIAAPAVTPVGGTAGRLHDDLRHVLMRMRQAGVGPEDLRQLIEAEIELLAGRKA